MLYELVLTHDCTVNFHISDHTHIYIPNAKAGQRVASGEKQMIETLQSAYFVRGYGTKIVEHKGS